MKEKDIVGTEDLPQITIKYTFLNVLGALVNQTVVVSIADITWKDYGIHIPEGAGGRLIPWSQVIECSSPDEFINFLP